MKCLLWGGKRRDHDDHDEMEVMLEVDKRCAFVDARGAFHGEAATSMRPLGADLEERL